MKAFQGFRDTLKVSKAVVKLIWETSHKYTVYVVILLTLNAFVPILEAYFIKKIIDNLSLSFQTHIAFGIILNYIIFFIIVTLFSRLVENQRNSTQIVLGNLFSKQINNKIVEKTTKLAFWRFEDPKFHDKLDRTRDQATWKPLNTFYHLFDSLQSVFMLLSIFVVLYSLSPFLVLLMVLFAIPSLVTQIKYGNIWWNLLYQETPDSRRLSYYQHLMTSINEMKDIKLLNLRSYLLSKYGILYEKLFNEQKAVVIKRYIWEFVSYLISDIILVLFYIYLAWQTYLRSLSIGDFTFYSTIYARGVFALHSLVKDIAGIYENNLFINELLEFLSMEEEKTIKGSKDIRNISKGFEFKDVWFKYPGTSNWILKRISFKLPLKESIALVGENGAGKTTIVKLLTRLYRPDKGEILLDGKNIEKFEINKYRQLFGVAFQDFARFHFSVEDNIRFGDVNNKISVNKIIQMAKKTQIHKKIMTLPLKYKTTLGRWFHEGHEISYGEWQRVAIARALIRDSHVYILDEPTAALDAKAEYTVFREFKKHVKGKTALFISHRFSNVKLADEILVLENGKIIQKGTHEKLIKQTGRYKQLYNFQAKRYKE